jgi:hypothetical protein
MSDKPTFDADKTIQLDGLDSVVELPPESEPPPRMSRATPPPLPASVSMPSPSIAPPAPPKASPARLAIYAVVAVLVGGGVLVGVMKAIAPKTAPVTAAPSASAAPPAVINMPTVELDDKK